MANQCPRQLLPPRKQFVKQRTPYFLIPIPSFHAVVLTSEPEDKLVRKLSSAVCAVVTLPELSAEPISESSLVNELALDELLVVSLLVEAVVELLLSVALLVDELLLESSRLVSES